MANSLEHLVNPKVITVSGNYEVAVDIANVDTYYGRQLGGPTASQEIQQAYIRQIGSTGISGQAYFSQLGTTGSSGQAFFNTIGSLTSRGNGYFDTIYWNSLVPFPSGGSGGSGTTFFAGAGISIAQNNSGATFSANLQGIQGINVTTPVSGPVTIGYNAPSFIGSTGINISLSGNTYRFSSTLGISGSQYIGVQQTGNTYTISYLGSQGGGATPVGISGSYAVFGASGIESSTVLTSTNIVGPTGRVMLYSPQGPTYNNLLTYADSAFPRIVTPFVESRYSNGILSLVPFTNANFIESAGINAKALPLNISGGVGSPNLTTFDIPQGKVTINPGNSYPSGVANVFSGSLPTTTSLAGGTYSVYLYGGGGAGLSGFAGGAGGFVKINGITGGSTIAFEQLTNANGGGVGIRLNVNGSSVAVAPGGGAGGSGGRGAAYGEPGGSYNGQGFSAKDSTPGPGAGGSGGVYTNFQTNGLTGYVYRIGITGATAQSGIFNNVQVTYGLTGDVAAGTRILAYSNGTIVNDNNSLIFPGFSTYYFPPGTTLSIQTNGITFDNSLYSFAGVTAGLINLSNINTSSLTGATFSRQAFGGTASIEGSTFQFLNGYVGGTFSGDGLGIDQLLVGATFTTGLTGLTLTAQAGRVVDSNISGGIQMDFPTALTFTLSRSLGSIIAPTLKITDPIGIAGNSIIQVQYQNTISRGQDGSSVNLPGINGGFFGGGNGDYGGGGGTGGGGGGAGGVYIAPGYSGVTGAGSGTSPFGNTYNFNGQYGFGGSGTTGGLPYYVIEKIDATLQPDVLQVNGNENVTGNLNVNGNISAYQPNTGGIQALLVHNNFDVNNRRGVSVFVDKTVEGPSIQFDNNSTTLPGPANQGGLLSYTRDTSGGFFSMIRPLSVQGNIYGYQTPIKVLLDSPVEVATNYIVPPNLPGRTGYLVHVKMMGGGGSSGFSAVIGGGGGSGFVVDTDGIKVVGGASILYLIGEGGGSNTGPGQGGQSEITFPGFKKLIAEGGNPGNGADGGAGGYGGGGAPGGQRGNGQLGIGQLFIEGGNGGGPSVLSTNLNSGSGGNGGPNGGGGGGLGGGNAGAVFQDSTKNATYYGAGGGGPFFSNGFASDGRGFPGVIFLTLTPY